MISFLALQQARQIAVGPLYGLIHIGADSTTDIDEALALGVQHLVLTTPDADLAAQATHRCAEQAGIETRIAHVACHTAKDFDLKTFAAALPTRGTSQRWLLRLRATADIRTLVSRLAAGQPKAPFSDLVVHVPSDEASAATLADLMPLGFIPLAFCHHSNEAGGELHLVTAPDQTKRKSLDRTLRNLRAERDALQETLDQITFDQRDLNELRARYGTLLSHYEAQSETLRQVQARIAAALARLEPPKSKP